MRTVFKKYFLFNMHFRMRTKNLNLRRILAIEWPIYVLCKNCAMIKLCTVEKILIYIK